MRKLPMLCALALIWNATHANALPIQQVETTIENHILADSLFSADFTSGTREVNFTRNLGETFTASWDDDEWDDDEWNGGWDDKWNCGGRDDDTGTPSPVPEPASMLLFGAGLIGLAGIRKKSKKNK